MLGDGVEGYDDYSAAIEDFPAEPLAEQPMGSFMLYSSGTTGRPKGIHRPLADQTIDEGGMMASTARVAAPHTSSAAASTSSAPGLSAVAMPRKLISSPASSQAKIPRRRRRPRR